MISVGAAWIYSTAVVMAPFIFPHRALGTPFYATTSVASFLVVLGVALEGSDR